MRKKKFYIKAVYDHPDRVFPLHGDPDVFRGWIDRLRGPSPLVVEFGAGTGDFLISQTERFPDQFFLAVEVKPDRLYKGFKKAEALGLKNIAFLQADVRQMSAYRLPPVDIIYLLFSDPWPKDRHHLRRLSSEVFLPIYRSHLSDHGSLVLKTDSRPLFEYSLEMFGQHGWRIDASREDFQTPEDEQTAYEKKFRHQKKPIFYVKAFPPRRPG